MTTPFQLRQASSVFYQGGIIAYPTEAVFGLGCDPLDPIAVQRLLDIKQRPVDKGLILLASNVQQLMPFTQLGEQHIDTIRNTPKPTTWLVPRSSLTPAWISGNHDRVAVRVTHHPPARQLCEVIDRPIVSTSANPAGLPPARSHLMLHRYFDDEIDFELPGDVGALDKPTRIIDIDSGRVMR